VLGAGTQELSIELNVKNVALEERDTVGEKAHTTSGDKNRLSKGYPEP
jgi:hypothetical protein